MEQIPEPSQSGNPEANPSIGPAMGAFLEVRTIVSKSLRGRRSNDKQKRVLSDLLRNVNAQILQQTQGMFAHIANSDRGWAEALASTVVETSIRLIFLLEGPRARRVFAYFAGFRSAHFRPLEEWSAGRSIRNSMKWVDSPLDLIGERHELLNIVVSLTDQVTSTCGFQDRPGEGDWNIELFQRFMASGEAGAYAIAYSHLRRPRMKNAQDTLKWLLGLSRAVPSDGDPVHEDCNLETAPPFEVLIRMVICFYIGAAQHLLRAQDWLEQGRVVREIDERLEKLAVGLSTRAGIS